MESPSVQKIVEKLQGDDYAELRTSIATAYLTDEQRGAAMVIEFAAKDGITLEHNEVVDYINTMDDDDWDIELTMDMLTTVAGGKKCQCQIEAHDEPWGRCPGMRPMRKWLCSSRMA